MNVTVGYTIFNKSHLISKIVSGLNSWMQEGDEVIFLFDNCSDGSLDTFLKVKDSLPCESLIVVPDEELFEIKANNQILKLASKDIIILFQDDMVCNDAAMKQKVSRVTTYYGGKAGLIGGRSGYELDGTENFNATCYDRVSNWEHKKEQYGFRLPEGEFRERTILNRGPLVFTRDLLGTVGYLDESFFPLWGDDVDYCCRSKFKYNRENVVFQCDIQSPLEWGAMRKRGVIYPLPDGTKGTAGTVMRRNWNLLMDRWGENLREYYENTVKLKCKTL